MHFWILSKPFVMFDGYWNDTALEWKEFSPFRSLHGFTPFAQECWDVEIGLLEIRDHGVAHAID